MSSVTVKFFAHIREQVGVDEIVINIDGDATMESVREQLCERSDAFAQALSGKVVMARNQIMMQLDKQKNTPVKAGDELAFFPPVTGG